MKPKIMRCHVCHKGLATRQQSGNGRGGSSVEVGRGEGTSPRMENLSHLESDVLQDS